MALKENIKKLSNLCAVSGFEFSICDDIKKLLEKYCHEVNVDSLGNVIGVKKGSSSENRVMLEAHMDEIGLMVTYIDDNGFLYFTSIGGIDARILPANKVTVHAQEKLTGIIGAKPPHLLQEGEQSKTIPMDKLFIDVGLTKSQAEKIIKVGDFVTFKQDAKTLGKTSIVGKSMDDRASVAIILEVLDKLKNAVLPFDLYVAVCVQEEVGRRGATTAAYGINPDFAIAIDVCHASTPDGKEDTYASGSGAVITKGPNLHPYLTENIIKVMDENKIKYNLDVEGGDTGTDAWAIQIAQDGIPTALFSIPLRYMHTPCEVLNISDAKMTAEGICAFLESIESVGDVLC